MSTTADKQEPNIHVTVPPALHGKRLDAALAALLPDYSRSRLQRLVRDGHVRLDGRLPECSDKVPAGAAVELDLPEPAEVPWKAEPIPLQVIHEDAALLVINKPPGLVVHPGAGNPEGTLLNAVMHHAPGIEAVPRAGIVHRLDKDTSGLLVVAKTDAVRLRLVRELQARRIKREYLALVRGVVRAPGSVTEPIGRHPVHRTRMSVQQRGKEATSHYSIKPLTATTPCCGSGWNPGAPTRSACTWRTSDTRWSAIRSTAAAARPATRARQWNLRSCCAASGGRPCTRNGSDSATRRPVRPWNGPRPCRTTCEHCWKPWGGLSFLTRHARLAGAPLGRHPV